MLYFALYSIQEIVSDGRANAVIDVDGSYLYKKYKQLSDAGKKVSLPLSPPQPPSGWITVTQENHTTLAPRLPPVTAGI